MYSIYIASDSGISYFIASCSAAQLSDKAVQINIYDCISGSISQIPIISQSRFTLKEIVQEKLCIYSLIYLLAKTSDVCKLLHSSKIKTINAWIISSFTQISILARLLLCLVEKWESYHENRFVHSFLTVALSVSMLFAFVPLKGL